MDYGDQFFDYQLPNNSNEHGNFMQDEIEQEFEHVDNMDENITIGDRCEFETDMVFKSRQSLIDWVQQIGRELGYIIIINRSNIGGFGKKHKLEFKCDRGGSYQSKRSSMKQTGTKKIDCPFQLKGRKMRLDDDWMIRVVCAEHNLAPALFMEGHPYPGRLTDSEIQIMIEMSEQNAKSRDILTELKKRDPNNVSTIRTIYNARKKHKTAENSGQSQMQTVFTFLNNHQYFFYYRADNTTNELEDLFFAHPGSLELLRAFPNVLLMDATYQTNRYGLPLLEIVGVTSTSHTFCIAFAYLYSEKEASYTWALECLRSAMHGCIGPQVIVTDRELGLMKACAQVFPEASKLLCRWHIYQSILTKCKPSIQDNRAWNAFYRMWTTVLESENESVYMINMTRLEVVLQKFPKVIQYLKDVWLTPYKEMIVSAWTDKYLHFGNHTTNRVESQHAKLKRYLCSSQSDLVKSMSWIHQVIQSQDTAIKASIERSRTIVKHRFNIQHIRDLCGFVSIEALNLMLTEFERSKDVGESSYKCGCHLRRSYGLPCAHEQAMYVSKGCTVPLDAIDKFWRKLDLLQCQPLDDDDIDCSADVQMFTEQFKQQPRHVKVSWLKKLRDIFRPSTTSLREPTVKTNTRGRPSTKKKVATTIHNNATAFTVDGSDFVPAHEPHRHSSSYEHPTSKIFEHDFFHSDEPVRHSCSSIYNTQSFSTQESSRARKGNYSLRSYIDQFPGILHPYIRDVQDVKADGNCGFRSIAVCLGLGEDEWPNVRYNMMTELNIFRKQYVEILGGEERTYNVEHSLNFFRDDVAAPFEHWMTMPDMGLLIASAYNVILHVLHHTQSWTYLPLRTTAPPPYQHVIIAIGHVNGNHYVKVGLTGNYPMPPITPAWVHCRHTCAAEWATSYAERFDAFMHSYGFNKSSSEPFVHVLE